MLGLLKEFFLLLLFDGGTEVSQNTGVRWATEAQKNSNISINPEKGQLRFEIQVVRSPIFQMSPIKTLSVEFHH